MKPARASSSVMKILAPILLFGVQACTTSGHRPSETPPPPAKSHLEALGGLGAQPWGDTAAHRGGLWVGDSFGLINLRYADCPDPELDVFWFWNVMMPLVVSHEAKITCPEHKRALIKKWSGASDPFSFDHADGKNLVNAWYRLSQLPVYRGSRSEAFAAVVQRARASKKKFELPEPLREYKIKAESDVREKHYWAAVLAYEKALEQAPEWAQGHYNLALLLGEAKFYVDAIDEMEKYLMLVPGAANRRAVLDKMYEWKGRLPEAIRPAISIMLVE